MQRPVYAYTVFISIVFLFGVLWFLNSTFIQNVSSAPEETPKANISLPPLSESGGVKWSEQVPTGTASGGKNLTKSFTEDLSSQFVSSIPADRTLSDSEKETLLQTIKEQGLQNTDFSAYLSPDRIGIVTSTPPSLKIAVADDTKANSDAYVGIYFSAMQELEKTAGGSAFADALKSLMDGGNSAPLVHIIEAYDTMYTTLSSAKVPKSMKDFHVKSLVFLKNMDTVLRAIADNQADPLRAYIAMQYIQTLSDEWASISSDFALFSKQQNR